MQIIVLKNYIELSRFAAGLVRDQLEKKKSSVFGLATGNTMLGLYKELVKMVKRKEISFKRATTFNLDEFVDLWHDHIGTLFYYMRRNFFDSVDLRPENIYFLDSEAQDHKKECRDYEKLLKKYGPIDMQFLGLGLNGHIGWCEPGTSFKSRTAPIELTQVSRQQQLKNFKSLAKMPKFGYSMGLATIMEAKQLILMVSGEEKAEILAKVLRGKIDKNLPASIVQGHKNVVVLLDRAAAKYLEN